MFNRDKIKKIIEEISEIYTDKRAVLKITLLMEILEEIESLNNSEIGLTSEFPNLNLEVRQSAILDKVKQSSMENGCGLKDLVDSFPDVSDRTLRYDLEKLVNRKLIVKMGNRGPNTTYKAT